MQKTITLTVAAFALLLAAPTLQADEGFFVFGDLQLLAPANTNHHLATIDTDGDDYEEWTLEYGSDLSFRLGGGYEWKGGESVSLSYWDYGDDEVETRYLASDQEFDDTFLGRNVEGDDEEAGRGRGEIEASSIELVFASRHDFQNKLSATWKTGLRYVDYEETLLLQWAENYDCGSYSDEPCQIGFDGRLVEADGIGPTVGIGAAYNANERVAIVSDVSFSYVFGDNESRAVQMYDSCVPSGNCPGFDTITRSDDVSGLITDLNAGVTVNVWGGLDLSLLYTFSSWEDIVTNYLGNGDDVDGEINFPIRDNVTFHGLNLRFRWLFGRE